MRQAGRKKLSLILISASGSGIFIYILTSSFSLSVAYSIIAAVIPILLARSSEAKKMRLVKESWPEIIDHLTSGINTGLTLSEAVSDLAIRGPIITRIHFEQFKRDLFAGMTFENAIHNLRLQFSDPLADQILIIIEFARSVGGRDTSLTLRTLGEVVRSDLTVRSEIEAKQGWIKNSAALASIAPWILLLILSVQNNMAKLYSTTAGELILIISLGLTAVAFFWMEKVSRISHSPRIFTGEYNYGQ